MPLIIHCFVVLILSIRDILFCIEINRKLIQFCKYKISNDLFCREKTKGSFIVKKKNDVFINSDCQDFKVLLKINRSYTTSITFEDCIEKELLSQITSSDCYRKCKITLLTALFLFRNEIFRILLQLAYLTILV